VPFTNPVVGGNTLIRTAIQSQGFAPGVTGWQIARDGSAEFNNATIRGNLTAGTLTAGTIGDSTVVNSDWIGGTITDPAITLTSTGGGYVAGYANAVTVNTYTGTVDWTVPAGVTSIKAECWGAGGGGMSGSGAGGGGGEYACNPALAVTPGESLHLFVGHGGAGGAGGSGVRNPGYWGDYTYVERSGYAIVEARGGAAAYSDTTPGGGDSGDPIHFPGGGSHSVSGWSHGGGGGGSSAGVSSAGLTGSASSGTTGGAGAPAVAGGGAGGHGGNGTGVGGTAGSAGQYPGGGGGSGGLGSAASASGGAGANGSIRISYAASAPSLALSVSPVATTDALGNTIPLGFTGYGIPKWGSSVVTTSAAGDAPIGAAIAAATGWTTLDVAAVWSGDGAATPNMTVGKMSGGIPYGTSFVVRCWHAASGTVFASSGVRLDWLAIGHA
jgi:hypothetical protein